jgi:hypothetical protein
LTEGLLRVLNHRDQKIHAEDFHIAENFCASMRDCSSLLIFSETSATAPDDEAALLETKAIFSPKIDIGR